MCPENQEKTILGVLTKTENRGAFSGQRRKPIHKKKGKKKPKKIHSAKSGGPEDGVQLERTVWGRPGRRHTSKRVPG